MNRTRWALVLLFLVSIWATLPHAQVTRYVYLTPVDGSGTDADPWHSRCLGMPRAGNIDLRPWGINRYLCASDTLPANLTGVVQWGTSLNATISAGNKTALETMAGKAITATTLDAVIPELLLSKIQAGVDGKLKIWLGEAVPLYQQTAWVPFNDRGYVADVWIALQPAVVWATTLTTETFTTSDGDVNGCNTAPATCTHQWTEFTGTAWAIVSNQADVNATSTTNEARADAALATINHYVQGTIVSVSGTGTGTARCGVIGRKDNTATRTFYAFSADAAPGGTQNFITQSSSAGSRSTIASTNRTIAANDVIALEINGSTVAGYVNGAIVVGPTTDSVVGSNTYGGLITTVSATNVSCTVDNWLAADGTVPTVGAGIRRRVL